MTRYVRKGRSVTAVMRDDGTVYFDVQAEKPVGELILEAQRRAARYIAETVGGVDDIAAVEAMVWLNMGAIRGMTLMELAGLDSGHTDAALRLLRANREAFLARLAREKK